MQKMVFMLSLLIFLISQPSDSSNHTPFFATVFPADLPTLHTLALKSHPIYQELIARNKASLHIFNIPESLLIEGIIEQLRYNHEPIGFYALHFDADPTSIHCRLTHLFIRADMQRKGFGTLLFERAIRCAAMYHKKLIRWTSDPHAKEFYLNMGATIIGYQESSIEKSIKIPIFQYQLDHFTRL